MSDETPGVGQQGAPPPRDGGAGQQALTRPTTQVRVVSGNQYVLTTQSHGMPALAQISSPSNLSASNNVTRLINLNPTTTSRIQQQQQQRPSLTNQSIVNILTKNRQNPNSNNSNIRIQLFPSQENSNSNRLLPSSPQTDKTIKTNADHANKDSANRLSVNKDNLSSNRTLPVKRTLSSSSTTEKLVNKDNYDKKLENVINHRIVRSKLLKEKYNEHLLESFYLESGNNLLYLYQCAKRPKNQSYLNYIKQHSIDNHQQQQHDEKEETSNVTVAAFSTNSPVGPSNIIDNSDTAYTTNAEKSLTSSSKNELFIKSSSSNTSNPSTNHNNSNSQELIVEKAKQEAYVLQRITDLQKEGLWSEKRLPKLHELPRNKAHWDFLLEEMVWLAADFAQERKWKKAAARKCARMVQKHFHEKSVAAQKAQKAQETNLRRIAAHCAKEIKLFWSNIEKLLEYKQNAILEERRKRALDQQLSFIVDQTEKYSQLLSESMNNKSTSTNNNNRNCPSSSSSSLILEDTEFQPDPQLDEDDEETIAREEEDDDNNTEQKEEIEQLQKESQMELDDLLEDEILRNYLLNRDKIRISDESDVSFDEDDENSDDSNSSKYDNNDSNNNSDDDDNEYEEEEEGGGGESGEDIDVTKKLSQVDEEHDELKLLVEDSKEGDRKTEETKGEDRKDDFINDAAAIAESIQPKGNTLSSTNVSTNIPFLLKYSLREYQHIGLDWLVTMYERKLNGILADEMGLGKTIQTIALLAHLACEKENWGPHLIVVPTSVMLNWEMECKKWCPAFKILTYYGTQKERKFKRIGWTKPNAFHICITSYKLVIQDHQSFRRKKWKYLILDEAQNIKNFKSQRWQLLLNFQTQQRLLLTGTPLQNNLMELWSLMHFLMPNVFQSHREFKEWFSNPVTGMIEGNSEYNESIIKRLHKVLRPFLLRRLKSEVEKQMPKKYEHVVMCRLSKRQRYLYDDYMSKAKTRETLASGNLLSVINVLMQLRKVCNHPNLFEVRPTTSPFQSDGIRLHIPSIIYNALDYDLNKHISFQALNLLLIMQEMHFGSYQCFRMRQSGRNSKKIIEMNQNYKNNPPPCPPCKLSMKVLAEAKNSSEKREIPVFSSNNPPPLQIKGINQSNVKMKVSGVQLVNPHGILKTIPVVNLSQTTTGSSNVKSGVDNKISASFAQLVQTSTGKHLLLTSNPSITANIPVTSTASGIGGQKLTFLSKQPVSTIGNASGVSGGHAVTKAYVKFQLAPSSTFTTTPNSNIKSSDDKKLKSDIRNPVGNDYIGKLYSKQNNLDVRWNSNEEKDHENDPKGERRNRLALMCRINQIRSSALPLYGRDFQMAVKIFETNKINRWQDGHIHCLNAMYNKNVNESTNCLKDMLYNPERRLDELKGIFDRFVFYVPAVKAVEPELQVWHPTPSKYWIQKQEKQLLQKVFLKPATPLHPIASAMITQFPDPRLIQYDCGKLQTLDILLRKLKAEGHRVLIFTQMTKMLDVLEAFLNYHGHIYLRLDGTTKVDQRQVLMERFNNNKRIFAFILSTRSGGVGVNLTGADTVIFYDSDWNPTMDAQAQDRCHRIGQTRDVHIYRLISERTIEENILKKANQKRLLGNLAIEGGNFTTAFFKSSTIQDLFNIDQTEENAATRMSGAENTKDTEGMDDKLAVGALENALAACEDDQDVQAAKIAKAEAVADLAEFDENIPLDEQEKQEKEPELSKAEQEINNVINKLSPIEKYAMKFIEATESAWSKEQLLAAEKEIEDQKKEWELNRLAAMREEEERRQRELEEDGDIITYSRDDATNQIWVSDNTMDQMPMWCPPTPPQQDDDVYMDQTMAFLYESRIMSESQLPAIYVKRNESKRNRLEAGLIENSRRNIKLPRKEESSSSTTTTNAPKSIFHSAAILKMRRDLKLQKYHHRGVGGTVRPTSIVNIPQKGSVEQVLFHEWTIHEDMAILKVVQSFQNLPLNLFVTNPGHTPNWDFVADYVNTVSITYRSPKQCRQRYDSHLMQREEGKHVGLDANYIKKKKNKSNSNTLHKYNNPIHNYSKSTSSGNKLVKTWHLYTKDNNAGFSKIMINRFEALKSLANSKKTGLTTNTRTIVNNPLMMNKTKHASVLNECGIDIEHPVLPVEVAARRAERLAKEKKSMTEQQYARLQMLKGVIATTQSTVAPSSTGTIVSSTALPQVIATQNAITTTASTVAVAVPATPPNTHTLRTQRIIASPIQTSTVVSVSGLSPAQLQAATQRLIVSSGGHHQGKVISATTSTGGTKTIGQAQLDMIRWANLKQQLRLHTTGSIASSAQQVKTSTSTITIGGQQQQQAVVQFTQAQGQPRTGGTAAQHHHVIRTVAATAAGKGTITGIAARTVTESEVAQLLKKQHLQQQVQQKLVVSASAGGTSGIPQVLAIGGSAGTTASGQIATLVKAVSSTSGVSQTVTIPVTGVALTSQGSKNLLTPTTLKTNNAAAAAAAAAAATQLRQLQLQQQLVAAQQKKLNTGGGQKLSIAQVTGTKNMQTTQLIVGSKPLPTAMTVQQFQQVIRSPLNVSQGPVVLAKGPSARVIPVNNVQGTKQTIQVVAAGTSQTINTALRPSQATSSTLAGALAGIKVHQNPSTGTSSQQQLLSQVSAALSQQNVTGFRQQASPVRIQSSSGGTPLVAVSVHNVPQVAAAPASAVPSPPQQQADQVNRFLKK